MATAFAEFKQVRSGVSRLLQEAHILLAAPSTAALLLGASINAGPDMILYYRQDGIFTPAVRLKS